MTTVGETALNEARALRLVLATVGADTDPEGSTQVARNIFSEMGFDDWGRDLGYVAQVLAYLHAEDLIIAKGEKKAARELEKQITVRLDIAAGGAPS